MLLVLDLQLCAAASDKNPIFTTFSCQRLSFLFCYPCKMWQIEGGLGTFHGMLPLQKEMSCSHRFHGECLERWLGVVPHLPTRAAASEG